MWLKAVGFGALQGLTEFLPISSSGHLTLFEHSLSFHTKTITAIEVVAHLGTLLAVLLYFRSDILAITKSLAPKSIGRLVRHPALLLGSVPKAQTSEVLRQQRLLGMIVVGTIPAALVGGLLKHHIEKAFDNLTLVGAMFLVTATLLFLTRLATSATRSLWQLWLPQALTIGAFQAVAILPGVSRSGATIAAGLFLGFPKRFAARFSFLLSIPAIAGALVLESKEILSLITQQGALDVALVVASSFAVGYAAIAILLKAVTTGKLHFFGYYCLLAGLATITLNCLS